MSRAILLGSLLALAQAGGLKAQDGPVRSVFPNLPNAAPSRDSGVMDVYGPEINVGLGGEELREIMRVLAAEPHKRRATRVIDNYWRFPGGYLFHDGESRGLFPQDFNAPSEQPRGLPDQRPAPNQRHGQVQILVMAESARAIPALER